MGPSKRTSCLTSSAPWLGATPFLPSNQYPSFQESWSPYGTHSCTMSEKHVYATANKETTLAPLGLYRNDAKSTGTWTFRFRTSSFETQQSTIRDCINVFLCSKKNWWMWIQSHPLQVSSHVPLLENSTEDPHFVRCRIPNTCASHHTPLNPANTKNMVLLNLLAKSSGDGVPSTLWIFCIWSISFCPGKSGNLSES